MNARNWGWVGIAVLTLGLASGLALQRQRVLQLRAEAALLAGERQELARLQQEHERLAAAQPSAEDWAAWRAAETERAVLEAELTGGTKSKPSPRAAPAMAEIVSAEPVPASAWSNAGRATPEATLETALWAAASGEVETLAEALQLEPEVHAQAQKLLASLPPASRMAYGTPERLVALLTAREIPIGTMQLVGRMERAPDEVLLRVRLQQPDGSAITKSLAARQQGRMWQLVVPATAITRFEAILRGPVP